MNSGKRHISNKGLGWIKGGGLRPVIIGTALSAACVVLAGMTGKFGLNGFDDASAQGISVQAVSPVIGASHSIPASAPSAEQSDHRFIRGLPEGSVEIIARRTESAKTFRTPDGKIQTMVSGGPLHYEQEGTWQTIDTRWQPYDPSLAESSALSDSLPLEGMVRDRGLGSLEGSLPLAGWA
ncbi:MAG: hypothetical protein ACLFPX_02705, partial [Candidatus Omnitrophota bacterium]